MFSPNISVIVPAKNEEGCIGQCIRSILDSSYPKERMEVLVAVDGSTDRTVEICKGFEPEVKVLEMNPKTCKAEALNEALPNAKGDIVAIFDADCVVDRDCIKEAVKHFSDGGVDGVSGTVKTYNRQKLLPRVLSLETCFSSFLEGLLSRFGANPHFSGKNFFLRRSVLEEVGYFDESSFLEDLELSIRMKRLGHKVVFEHRAVTMQNEPEDIRSYVSQRRRWARGTFRLKRLKMQNSLNSYLSDLMHCIPYYISPLSLIVIALVLSSMRISLFEMFAIPLTALFLFSLSLIAYSRVFFKESLADLALIPVWLVLMSAYTFLIMPLAYVEEKKNSMMRW
jgi:cellulose synthase/poly-beta-1,6-N-acetylglucosamine synthase-like glycosyltransferase